MFLIKNIFDFIVLCSMFVCVITYPLPAGAETTAGIDHGVGREQRLDLARSFLYRLKKGLALADDYLEQVEPDGVTNILDEGTTLLLQPVVAKKIRVDGIIFARAHNGEVIVSLRDVTDALQFSISMNEEKNIIEGWYIREGRSFFMDIAKKFVRTDIGEFSFSENVVVEEGDVFVPAHELGKWMDINFVSDVSAQELRVFSDEPLPIEERYLRRQRRFTQRHSPDPILPRIESDGYTVGAAPSIDVLTRSTYRKSGADAKGRRQNDATIRAVGDLAYGTLTTQLRIDDKEQLSSLRANYKRESVDDNLLGPLHARRFELGDVATTQVPLGGAVGQELGVRITNTDTLRGFSTPSSAISGTAFPGWDVELYRTNQLIGFREVDDSGFYSFDDVSLFLNRNNFKLVFYGPQGEVREELVSIPVDFNKVTDNKGVYDVSVSLDRTNTYNNQGSGLEDEDEGQLNIAARYEKLIANGTSVSAGVRSAQDEGVRNTVGNLGYATTVWQALVNADVAVDDEGELAAEFVVRRDVGEHQMSNTLKWQAENFDSRLNGVGDARGRLQNSLSLTGPLPVGIGVSPVYSFGANYFTDTTDRQTLTTSLGFNTSFSNISFNEQVTHTTSNMTSDDSLESFTNISGAWGRNRVRLGAEYAFKPENELRNVRATYQRDVTNDLNVEFGVNKGYNSDVTEYSAKLDWQAGFMRISPSIRYDDKHAFFAGLNTRFGLLKDPLQGRLKMYDYTLANSGSISAFVYLDKNGDGVFNGDDEPLEDVVVRSLQNGGRKITDENGLVLFTRLAKLRMTDVLVDNESLQDPIWVTGFDGASVVPREGHVVSIEFPVHLSGELDGSVYAQAVPLPLDADGGVVIEPQPVALRNINLKLYNVDGEIEKSVLTDFGGFYYMDRVPPGRYLLVIDEKSAQKSKFIRPEPQQIEIGYDGTVIYGNNIYVETGRGDIPSVFVSDLSDYKERHPHIDFSDEEYDLVLNLGEYNSRLLMSVVWYKIQSRYKAIIDGGELFVPPTQSYANIKTGKHVLRVGLHDKTLKQAYDRCRSLMARDQYCKVEIYPSYMKQAQADTQTFKQVEE